MQNKVWKHESGFQRNFSNSDHLLIPPFSVKLCIESVLHGMGWRFKENFYNKVKGGSKRTFITKSKAHHPKKIRILQVCEMILTLGDHDLVMTLTCRLQWNTRI